jgi:glucose-6-phosphate isomerase
MLTFDSSGLYGDGLLSRARQDEQRQELEGAIEALQARFDAGELGFVHTPDADGASIVAWANQRRSEGWTDQLVIGIGGSSLGAEAVLDSALPGQRDGLRAHFADNLDPESVDRLFRTLDPKKTMVVVITKSGTTIETMSQFWLARQWLAEAVGEEEANKQIVAITDPESGELRKLVDKHGWWDFDVPPNVGGRFSVLTPVGLVPLALAGYPIQELLEGARSARDRREGLSDAAQTWGTIAAEHLALADAGYDELVMMTYGDRLTSLVDWFCQLWAESLGKARDRQGELVHRGMTPIKAVGVTDQHSQVQLYMEGPHNKHMSFLEVQKFEADRIIPDSPPLPEALQHLQGKRVSQVFAAELKGTRDALRQAGRPTSSWVFERITPASVGAFLFSWQMITAVAGELMDINAFDQPGVEMGKKIAHGLLGRPGYEEYAKQGDGSGKKVSPTPRNIL